LKYCHNLNDVPNKNGIKASFWGFYRIKWGQLSKNTVTRELNYANYSDKISFSALWQCVIGAYLPIKMKSLTFCHPVFINFHYLHHFLASDSIVNIVLNFEISKSKSPAYFRKFSKRTYDNTLLMFIMLSIGAIDSRPNLTSIFCLMILMITSSVWSGESKRATFTLLDLFRWFLSHFKINYK
jgi:hypothetical protein